MNANNREKSKQLGMPYGTAGNRLRKLILFSLLKKHGENFCYRCLEEIETVEDLSIEHKKPWLHVSPDLFWDLTNIAFSHLNCNVAAARIGLKGKNPNSHHRKFDQGPEGTLWCDICKEFKDKDMFHKNKYRTSGYEDICAECCKNRIKNSK